MSWFASRDLHSRVNLASKLQLRILEGKIWRWNGKVFPTITLNSLRKEKGRTKTKHYYLHREEARGCVSGRRELPICLCVWAPEQWGSGALQCPLSWQLSDESPMSCRSPEQEKRTVEPEVNFSPLMAACGGVPGWPQSTSAWQGDKWENKAARAFKDLFFFFPSSAADPSVFSVAKDVRIRAYVVLLMRAESGFGACGDVPHLLH